MAKNERGSRRIVVNDRAFRWRVPRYPVGESQGLGWSPLRFSAWLADDSGSLLEVEASAARPDNWLHAPAVVITPRKVAELIRRAMEAGWIRPDQVRPSRSAIAPLLPPEPANRNPEERRPRRC